MKFKKILMFVVFELCFVYFVFGDDFADVASQPFGNEGAYPFIVGTIHKLHSIHGTTYLLEDKQYIVEETFGSQLLFYEHPNHRGTDGYHPDDYYRIGKFNNIQFDKSTFYNSRITNLTLNNCSFRDVTFHGGNYFFYGKSAPNANNQGCDFTNATIHIGSKNYSKLENSFRTDLIGYTTFHIYHSDALKQTKSYKEKNLSNVDLLIGADTGIDSLDFSGFDLSFASLRKWQDMKKPIYSNNYFLPFKFENAFLFYTTLPINKEQLYTTESYKNGTINYTCLMNDDFTKVNFSKMNLTGCRFYKDTNFQDADFTDAVISDCDFEKVIGLTYEQIKSTWNYKNNRMDDIKLPKEIKSQLNNEIKNAPPFLINENKPTKKH
jgi:uncharacterized protein YjbI with pentapeptide repeats